MQLVGNGNRLRRAVPMLGQDEVGLRVTNEEKVTKLKLPNIYTNYCPELDQRLVELLGEGGLRVETINGAK